MKAKYIIQTSKEFNKKTTIRSMSGFIKKKLI